MDSVYVGEKSAIWLTGLSGSGKTTLAEAVYNHCAGSFATYHLDGDKLRLGLNKGLGFSKEDRLENIRRAAEVSKLFAESGIIVLASFINPYSEKISVSSVVSRAYLPSSAVSEFIINVYSVIIRQIFKFI